MLRRNVWLGLALGGLVCGSLGGCVGGASRQSAREAKQQQIEEQLRVIDASGRRVLFKSGHGELRGKWRVRRSGVKVYDAALKPVGVARIVRDTSDVRASGSRFNGQTISLVEFEPGHYHLDELLTLEHQGAKGWLVFDHERHLIARLIISEDHERIALIESAQPDALASYTITRDAKTREALLRRGADDAGELLLRAPGQITPLSLVPFALSLSIPQLDPLATSVLAMGLERVVREEADSP